MKKFNLLGLLVMLVMLFSGCEKADDPAGQRGVAVIPVISNVEPGIFNSKDLVNSYVEFVVKFDSGMVGGKTVIVGSYNGKMERIQIAEVSTFPATIRIVSGDAIQKLGILPADIVNGDVFTFEALTTVNGVTTRSNTVLNVAVACAFEAALSVGSYHSVSLDWNSAGDVTVTADPADPYTIYVAGLEAIEGLNEDQGPLVMHINPATYEVTVDETILASDAWGYGYIKYGGSGVYNSCDGTYNMNYSITLENAGAQGIFVFTLTRN